MVNEKLKNKIADIKRIVEVDIKSTENFIRITKELEEENKEVEPIYLHGLLYGLEECQRLLTELNDRINNILEEREEE